MSWFQFLKSKIFFKHLAIALISMVILLFGFQWWLSYTTNHDQKIQVPDLNQLTIEEAALKLEELKLGFIVIDSASYNPNYPKRSVIEQTPQAGDFVKEKRKIYLTLNPTKYQDITIPDLNGRTKRQAMTQLQSIGFQIGSFTYIPDIGKDVVRGLHHRGKKLKSGEKLPKNSVIDLTLGDGNGR